MNIKKAQYISAGTSCRKTWWIQVFMILLLLCGISLKAQQNQYAYMPESVKYLFTEPIIARSDYTVVDSFGSLLFSAHFSKKERWNMSGTTFSVADLSAIKENGRYYILVRSDTLAKIDVCSSSYRKVGTALVKGLYFARASMGLTEEYAGPFARPAGHPDNEVLIHSSAASASRPVGSVISSPGGWYDAGDYNKYIVNSSISVFALLNLFDMFPSYAAELTLNIPEKENSIPDIIDEALYNLRWMLTMQDPFDGGVYHKLTNKTFGGMVMPHDHNMDRFVVMKTTAATLDFAATMAKASRVLMQAGISLQSLADSCLAASRLAWEWSMSNPDIFYVQPADIKTGAYGDEEIEDEWFWAATELYLATGESAYRNMIDIESAGYSYLQWRHVGTLGLMSIVNSDLPENNTLKNAATSRIIESADKLLGIYRRSAYRIPMNEFEWGSNGDLANNGLVLIHAYLQTENEQYLEAADAATAYLLGANPLKYSFVTGFGERYPHNLHDRRISSDGIDEPIPGLLAGGPTPNVQIDCGEEIYGTKYPAISYVDNECSYSTNEVAINWNTAAAGLFLSLDAIYKKEDLK